MCDRGDVPMYRAGWPTEQVLIPDLLRAAPQSRRVLDRYGLRGCGGKLGPVESLGFFAKVHDVPIAQLLREIEAAVQEPDTPEPVPPTAHLADTIYRPFFRAGIAIILTLGAVWGAYLLLRIGFSGSFTAVGLHEVNAHGHAQIFGWVGLFVMGFAYQAFPRFKHTTLTSPGLAYASLVLMLLGIVGRSLAEPLARWLPAAGTAAIGASVLELLAIGIFVSLIVRTLGKAEKAFEAYDYYILSALAWFVLQAIYDTVYLAATLAATGSEQLLPLVATYQGALREMQIHGFAMLMILGVSQRIFHHFYGLPAPNPRLSRFALVALNTAIVGEVLGLILMRTSSHGWAVLWYASVLLLTITTGILVSNWRIFSPPEDSDRSLKFLRAAYLWLFISLGMLVLLPVYQFGLLRLLAPESGAATLGFSHAYYGAVRHAITVGFISLMIVGVAAKVVPTLNGVDVRALPALWLPFVLINTGCALRVTAQTLTDFTPAAFPVAGVSGLLEVAGLALWGCHLWAIMAGRARLRPGAVSGPALLPGDPVTADHVVADVLDCYPTLLDTFVARGFRPLANPLLRRALARTVTVRSACRMVGHDVDALVAALNAARPGLGSQRLSLPVLVGGSGNGGAPAARNPSPFCELEDHS